MALDARSTFQRPFVEDLERQALALDAMAAAVTDDEEALAALFARRHTVLVQLDVAGLFDGHATDEKLQALRQWSCPTLVGYLCAAAELHRYYRSAERAREILDLEVPPHGQPPILGGPVSLDWFRRGARGPEQFHPYAWLGYFEWLLRTSKLHDGMAGCQITGIGGNRYSFSWRRDDLNNPALVSGALVR